MSRESDEQMKWLWNERRQLEAERSKILTTLAAHEKERQQIYDKIGAFMKRIGATVMPKTTEGDALMEELRLQNFKMSTVQEDKVWNSLQLDFNRKEREELRLKMASERQQQGALPPLHQLPR